MTSQLQPIPCDPHTALLLIDNQVGFLHPTYWGSSRSTPSYESNLTALINAFRSPKAPEGRTSSPLVINVQHLSKTFSSPLHPDYIGSPDSNFAGQHGSDFLPFAKPDEGEPIVIKSVNSAFIGTGLEKLLRENEITTLVITGITTDHCVSTTTRMAANLGVVNYDDKKGRIILVSDATATFAKGGYDAETVHAVNLASLSDEFAEIRSTAEVLELLDEGK